jgi:hypothetical protein
MREGAEKRFLGIIFYQRVGQCCCTVACCVQQLTFDVTNSLDDRC